MVRAHGRRPHGSGLRLTVPPLTEAIHYGMGVLADAQRRRGWEGTAILVAGSDATVREARQAVARIDDELR